MACIGVRLQSSVAVNDCAEWRLNILYTDSCCLLRHHDSHNRVRWCQSPHGARVRFHNISVGRYGMVVVVYLGDHQVATVCKR